MKLDIDFLTGRITIETTVDELVMVGLVPEPEPAEMELPDVEVYHVGRYTQVLVYDPVLGAFWVCSCNDYRYRRQTVLGDECKHIMPARFGGTLYRAQ